MMLFLRRLAHYAVYLLAGVVILLCLIALALRFLIMPDIGRYKSAIEASASRAVGMPVKIAEIQADWSHIDPRFHLRDLTLAPPGQPTPLHLARVDATLSWLSLIWMEPHLSNLDIYQPTLEIRRDPSGDILVAGIPVNAGGTSSPFPDWLLRQRSVTVSDGKVIWIDQARGAPPLTLEHVNLVLANRFSQHRFGLVAQPPADAAKSIDLRGNVEGSSIHDPLSWHGRIYMRVNGASAAALNTWSPWGQSAVHRSRGDVRFWMDFGAGHIQQVTGDVRLSDVAVSLAEGLPDMAFDRVSGRLVWSRVGDQQTYLVQGLRFVTASGRAAEPSSVKVSFTPTATGKVESAHVVADNLRLEALTALSSAIPLPRQARDWINTFNPRGYIKHIDLDWLGKEHFRLLARFQDAGMNPSHNLPGLTGLNGEIEANEHQGQAKLDSNALHIVYNKIFRQPLDLNRLATEIDWSGSESSGYHFKLAHCELANPDLAGTVQGSLDWRPGHAPIVDIRAHLSRGRGAAVWRYLPHQVAEEAYTWVKRSIVGGTSPNTTLILRGPLDRYPFDQGGGLFQVSVRMHNGVLDYAPGWPRITGIEGLLTFQGKGMTIKANSGEILGTHLSSVQGVIPDLSDNHGPTLTIQGQADGPTSSLLDFIRSSPVNEYMGHFTDKMKAAGNAGLNLKLSLPLDNLQTSRVTGRLTLKDNAVTLNNQLPPLDKVNGTLRFTKDQVTGKDVSAQLYGQPVEITLASGKEGGVHAGITGKLTAADLSRWLPDAIARHIEGSTPVQADISLGPHRTDLELNSRLAGLSINLPAPLGKQAGQEVPFTLTTQEGESGLGSVSFRYGPLLAGLLVPGESAQKTRLALMFGGRRPAVPKEAGVTVQGDLKDFDFDTWRKFGSNATGGSLPIRSVNLSFNELRAFDHSFHNINIQAEPDQKAWRLRLNGEQLQGEVLYEPKASGQDDRLTGRFDKLDIPASDSKTKTTKVTLNPNDLPRKIDVTAKTFVYRGHALGQLTLKLISERSGLSIEKIAFNTQETRLAMHGWLSTTPMLDSQLQVKLDSDDLGHLMGRLGYDEDIKKGKLEAKGELNWRGRLADFDKDKLDGQLKLKLENGRFTQLDPGAAKLLGILSLQALPRHITLDFRDIFSKGFAFDHIEGEVVLDRGIGYLPDLYIQGPAATIHMKGKIDLVRESQELRLHIQPRLDEGVAVAGALLGGPVVGVGTLVAAKILKNPIAKAVSYEYLVTGTWEKPIVTKLAKPVAGNAPTKP